MTTSFRSRLPRTVARTATQGDAPDKSLKSDQFVNPLLDLADRTLLPSRRDSVSSTDDGSAPKLLGLSIEQMREQLDSGIRETQWFVTGRVRKELFADEEFVFQDPDVTVKGIDGYCRGVSRLFHPDSVVDVMSTTVIGPQQVQVVWRLAARVRLGPFQPTLKPYVVTTDFTTGQDGLVVRQEDRFSIPGWEILLSAFFPGLGSPPAPPVERK